MSLFNFLWNVLNCFIAVYCDTFLYFWVFLTIQRHTNIFINNIYKKWIHLSALPWTKGVGVAAAKPRAQTLAGCSLKTPCHHLQRLFPFFQSFQAAFCRKAPGPFPRFTKLVSGTLCRKALWLQPTWDPISPFKFPRFSIPRTVLWTYLFQLGWWRGPDCSTQPLLPSRDLSKGLLLFRCRSLCFLRLTARP